MEPRLRLERVIRELRAEHAPDPRTAVFEVELEVDDGVLTLSGATSEAAAAEQLHRAAALLDGWREVRDEIQRLPAVRPGTRTHALATAAVVPLLAGPSVTEPHVSQVVLGKRLIILRRSTRWLQCRAADGYIGWVHRGYVREASESDARGWELGSGGKVCISLGAAIRDGVGETIARLPWGARVILRRGGNVLLPDGRDGVAEGELLPLAQRPARFPARGDQIVRSGTRWLGAPYLWGGITPAGVDCSGFVQALFELHGIELPRDSDQQARVGEAAEPGRRFEQLRTGDVLFFAESPHRVSHVAVSTGGSGILHSSIGNGGVRRNDLLGKSAYERELRNLFVSARRYLGPS